MAMGSESAKNHGGRLCLSVTEAAKMLGISRGLAYELVNSGQLPVIRLKRRLLVPKVALERMLSQPNSSAGANNSKDGGLTRPRR